MSTLPLEWREWSADERRAVLAHELAHACRGDYLSSLVAQVSLIIHFYHPLLRWLAQRLRLEQELAADAVGAAVCGGGESYLRVLAQLALRIDDRLPPLPSRSFLPTRGMFLRRVEMLRNVRSFRQASLTWGGRTAVVATLCLAGIGAVGLQAPAPAISANGHTYAETPQEAFRSALLRGFPQTAPAKTRAPAGAAAPGQISLDYVPLDAVFFAAVRVSDLAARDELKPVVSMLENDLGLAAQVGMPLDQIEQVAFVMLRPAGPTEPGRPAEPNGGIIVRAKHPTEWKRLVSQLFHDARSERFLDRTYYRVREEIPNPPSYFFADDRTIVLDREQDVKRFIARAVVAKPAHSWASAWQTVPHSQAVVMLDVPGLVGPGGL